MRIMRFRLNKFCLGKVESLVEAINFACSSILSVTDIFDRTTGRTVIDQDGGDRDSVFVVSDHLSSFFPP